MRHHPAKDKISRQLAVLEHFYTISTIIRLAILSNTGLIRYPEIFIERSVDTGISKCRMIPLAVDVAQLARALDCDSRGRGFKSRLPPIF